MQLLALSRRNPGTTAQQLGPLAAAEALAVHKLVAAGVIRSAHMCPERVGAMIVLECADLPDANAQLATLPMVAQGLISFDVTRMLPYTGYAALLDEKYQETHA
jgi:hypothetical protein